MKYRKKSIQYRNNHLSFLGTNLNFSRISMQKSDKGESRKQFSMKPVYLMVDTDEDIGECDQQSCKSRLKPVQLYIEIAESSSI